MLDVGCGAGRLACALAARSEHVDGLDRSPLMIDRARRRCPGAANVRWLEGDLLDPGLPLADDGYDAITAVSSLHHMALEGALERLVVALVLRGRSGKPDDERMPVLPPSATLSELRTVVAT